MGVQALDDQDYRYSMTQCLSGGVIPAGQLACMQTPPEGVFSQLLSRSKSICTCVF